MLNSPILEYMRPQLSKQTCRADKDNEEAPAELGDKLSSLDGGSFNGLIGALSLAHSFSGAEVISLTALPQSLQGCSFGRLVQTS